MMMNNMVHVHNESGMVFDFIFCEEEERERKGIEAKRKDQRMKKIQSDRIQS